MQVKYLIESHFLDIQLNTLLDIVFFDDFVNKCDSYAKCIYSQSQKQRMEMKMEHREILFEKIDAKQKEWQEQVKHMKLKAAEYDSQTREKIEKQISALSKKLKEIEKQTNELKRTSNQVQGELGDKIVHSWIEVFTKIDDAISRLKR